MALPSLLVATPCCISRGSWVNPDVGSKVNQNALVVVRTELRQSGFIDTNPINICKVNPQICVLKP